MRDAVGRMKMATIEQALKTAPDELGWVLVHAHTKEIENATYRMKIPEGWLYRYGSALVFVPS